MHRNGTNVFLTIKREKNQKTMQLNNGDIIVLGKNRYYVSINDNVLGKLTKADKASKKRARDEPSVSQPKKRKLSAPSRPSRVC